MEGRFKKEKEHNLLSSGELTIAITDVTRNADIIGKSFLIPDTFDEMVLISCDVASIRSSRISKYYLEKLFNSEPYHRYIKHFASGTLVLHLNIDGIKWFKSVIPSTDLSDSYSTICEKFFYKKNSILMESARLVQLRNWLLPMLTNGQVTVK